MLTLIAATIWCLFITVYGNQLIGFNSFIYGEDKEIYGGDRNIFNSWPELNDNGFYNYYIYDGKKELFLLPIEGIYFLSTNLLIETSEDNTTVSLSFNIKKNGNIACKTFKYLKTQSKESISMSCFTRMKEMTELDLIVDNTKDITVLIGSTIGIQYIGLPGVIASFVMPLVNKEDKLIGDMNMKSFMYFNTFGVLNDLNRIRIKCEALYLLSINAIVKVGRNSQFRLWRNSNESLFHKQFTSDATMQSLVLFKALKLNRNDVLIIEFNEIYFYEDSLYSIIKLNEMNENANYFALRIPPAEIHRADYSYGQANIEIPLSKLSPPYFANMVKLNEKNMLQLQNGGLYFISASFTLDIQENADFDIVLNTEDGLEDMEDQNGFRLAYGNKLKANGLVNLQMNGLIESKKNSIISFVIVSKNLKSIKILEPSSLFLLPVPAVKFQGRMHIKELEKNLLICSENGNLIKGFNSDGYGKLDPQNTYLNRYVLSNRDGYRIPTSGIYFFSLSMVVSSAEAQNGNISVNILSKNKVLIKQITSFSLFANIKETVKVSHTMNLNKDFIIQIYVKCYQKLQIQDGIKFNILLLKSTEKSLYLSLPINQSDSEFNLQDSAISGEFEIPEGGTYLVHIQQSILFRNIRKNGNYIVIYVYQKGKDKSSGSTKRLYLSASTNAPTGTETLSVTDIIAIEDNDNPTVIVLLELFQDDQTLIVSFKNSKASFYKFSSFYGFKAKENTPKLLSLINNQVSLGNLKFEGDGGFIYPTTAFFGRSNFIIYKTMTVFYSVLIETQNVKAGSLMLVFLLRPSGKRVEVSPYVKGKSWSLLEAYGTLELEKGEILQLTIESSVAEQVLVSRSSWAMMELVDPLMPMNWINKVSEKIKKSSPDMSVYVIVNGINDLLLTQQSTDEIDTSNTVLIGKQILSLDQWNNKSYEVPSNANKCINVYLTAQNDIAIKNDSFLVLQNNNVVQRLVIIPNGIKQNSINLCMKRNTIVSIEQQSNTSAANISIVPIHYHYSLEAFSSITEQTRAVYATDAFTRIEGWTTKPDYFYKMTQNFRDLKGAYFVKENGYYVIVVNVKFTKSRIGSKCLFMIKKDDSTMARYQITSNKSFVYNNVIWLKRLNAIQVGVQCDVPTNVSVERNSLFSVLLIDSHPTFDTSCTSYVPDLLINTTKPTKFIQSNTDFSLACHTSQNAFADFYWYKNNTLISETIGRRESVLLLQNVSQSDDGEFYCMSETGMIEKRSNNINLIIIDPTPFLTLSNATVFVEENYAANKLLAWIRTEAKNPETNTAAKVALSIINGDPESNFYFLPSITKEFSTIYFRRPFNFEKQRVYDLTIEAENIDFASNSKALSFILLRVIVINRNDHLPVFSKDVESFSVKENTRIGTKVCTVKAIDLDKSDTDVTRYNLLSTTDSSLFRINKRSGEIFVAKRIDYETTQFVNLMCSVDDGTFTNFKQIKIQIIDQNDNRPYFSRDSYEVNITVEANVNSEIFQLTAFDKDSGKFGEISFSIVDGNEMNTFRIFNKSILLNRKLKTEKRYQLYVTAVDGGNLYCFNPAHVYVNVAEAPGINIPMFEKAFYDVSLDEGTVVPVTLIDLKLSSKRFESVYYKAKTLQSSENFVEISPQGRLVLKQPIDYEENKYLSIIVSACVLIKKEEACGTSYLTITIRDINDNPPVFLQSFYSVSVSNSIQVGDAVIKLEARDEDDGENGKFRFFLQNFNGIFSVDKIDGTLTLSKQFNRTIFKSFKLYVEVRDNGKPSLSSNCYVSVIVEQPLNLATRPPLKLEQEDKIPLIENWMFWAITIAVILIIIIPVAVIALCIRYKRMKREMIERLKLREENSNHEIKGLISYLSQPAESVECMLSFSCETIPSAYSSKKNLSASKHSVNGVLVHSSENWDDTLTSEDDSNTRNDSLDDNSHKSLLNGSAVQRNGRFKKL